MPPPYTNRYNPVATNRARFTGEALPSPWDDVPSGQGSTMLGAYVPAGYAASSRMDIEQMGLERDKMQTQLADNYLRRREAQFRNRLLPVVNEADIAAANLRKTTAELGKDNAPTLSEAQRQQALLDTEKSKAEMRLLPDQVDLKAKETHDELINWSPGDNERKKLMLLTKDPKHILAYEDVLNSTDAKLPLRQRQQKAYSTTAALIQDQPAVDAIESQLMDKPDYAELRAKLIQDELTPDGRYLGSRVNPKADRGEVNRLLRAHENWKQRKSVSDEERRSTAAMVRAYEQEDDNIATRMALVEKRINDMGEDSASEADKTELSALKKQRERIKAKKLDAMGLSDQRPDSVPQADLKRVDPAIAPVTAPATPVTPAAPVAEPADLKKPEEKPRFASKNAWLR